MMAGVKTIFITITRGLLVRNILRMGILDKILERDNIKVVIFIPHEIPEYFRQEFNHPNITLEVAAPVLANNFLDKILLKIKKLCAIIFSNLIYNESECGKLKYGWAHIKPENKLVFWSKHIFFSTISKIKILKIIVRWMEQNIFLEKIYDHFFEKYKPNLVFCSSIYSKMDIAFIKAAKRFNITSISMPKSWDTIGRLFFRTISDKMILNNNLMKDWASKHQIINKEDIFVCGFPQFDVYKNKNNYLTKDEFCQKTNLDPNKPIILFISEGITTHWDDLYVKDLIINHNILEKYNLVVRPHFSNLKEKKYHRFKYYTDLYVDDENTRVTGMFGDQWDLTKENVNWLTEVVNASDVVINFVSTFVFDSFVNNKPVINIYYDLTTDRNGIVPMKEVYNTFHYNMVLAENATILAKNGEEVMGAIKKYLNEPQFLEEKRKKTVEKLCFLTDGQASQRIVNIIFNHL